MIGNELTVNVDLANSGSTTPVEFKLDESYLHRNVYTGPNHSVGSRRLLGTYRTRPTISGNYRGTSKTAVKLTRDVPVLGADGVSTITSPRIIEVSISDPLGSPEASLVEDLQTIVALMDNNTFALALIRDQQI
jgi:hypothetical protein